MNGGEGELALHELGMSGTDTLMKGHSVGNGE